MDGTPNPLSRSSAALLRHRRSAPASSRPDVGDKAALYGQEQDPPATREEAAQRFEEVFIRQFVKKFTEEMFSTSLTDSGGASLKGQKRMQRDQMTELLTNRLTRSDALNFDEQLLEHWQARFGPDESTNATS